MSRLMISSPRSPCFMSVLDVTVLLWMFLGDKTISLLFWSGAIYPNDQSVFNNYGTASFVSNEAGIDGGGM